MDHRSLVARARARRDGGDGTDDPKRPALVARARARRDGARRVSDIAATIDWLPTCRILHFRGVRRIFPTGPSRCRWSIPPSTSWFDSAAPNRVTRPTVRNNRIDANLSWLVATAWVYRHIVFVWYGLITYSSADNDSCKQEPRFQHRSWIRSPHREVVRLGHARRLPFPVEA